jgi:tetratricopeptide (TPR) repeat protein
MAIARSGVAGISPLGVSLICADIGLVHKRRGEYDLAIAACEEGLQAIQDDPNSFADEMIEARLNSELGGIYGMRGDYPRAQQYFEDSLKLRELVDDLPGMTASHNNLGYLWQLQSEYERAIEHYRVAEELAKKINLRHMIVFAAGNAASALISLGEYAEAAARCGEVMLISQEIHAQHNIAQSYDMLGLIAYHQGDYERALEAYGQALQLDRSLGSAYPEANTLIHIALTMNAQARFAEAAETAQQALDRAESLRGQGLKVESLNALAAAALGRDDLAAATTYGEEALALGRSLGSKRDIGIALRLLGQAASVRGEPFDAAFEESNALFAAIKDRFEIARTWAAHGKALLAARNENAGYAYLKQARDTFVAIGAHGELQRLPPIVERSI